MEYRPQRLKERPASGRKLLKHDSFLVKTES